MPEDTKSSPERQDGPQEPKPAEVASASNNRTTRTPHNVGAILLHQLKQIFKLAGVGMVVVVTTIGVYGWIENRVDKAVEDKLGDPIILRKIAAEARPSLVFDAAGSILHDMGAAQYLKVDDIQATEHQNVGAARMPTKLHIGFVRPVSFSPLVTSLGDPASIGAAHGKGLDWDFTVNWTVASLDQTNDSSYVFRLELVP